MNFPDLAIRTHRPSDPNEPLQFELSTYNVDADEDGRAVDFGRAIVEGGIIVGDGSKDGYDDAKIRQLLSLLEHAPDLFHLLQKALHELPFESSLRPRVDRMLREIEAGELVYGGR